MPRQLDDDARCAAKYGALWDEYCRRVPYRIIPWILLSAVGYSLSVMTSALHTASFR